MTTTSSFACIHPARAYTLHANPSIVSPPTKASTNAGVTTRRATRRARTATFDCSSAAAAAAMSPMAIDAPSQTIPPTRWATLSHCMYIAGVDITGSWGVQPRDEVRASVARIAYHVAVSASPDRDAARGQYRTTTTNFAKVPPYVRFRYERAADLLPDHGEVVELGCGVGVGLSHLAKSRPDLSFRGVDMSEGAIEYGRSHFGAIPNLRLEVQPASLETLADELKPGTFLVALEVLEHLDNDALDVFKTRVMENVDAAVFSFPYDQKNIEGTDHLQSFTIYDIFETFPGFETIFIRRHSIKFIGYWERRDRGHVREQLGVAKEAEAIARTANTRARAYAPSPSLVARLRNLRDRLLPR